MTQFSNSFFINSKVILILIISSSSFHATAQEEASDNIAKRFFMPAIKLGYIYHNSDNISSGMMRQTSLEYRTKKNLLFRLSYDDFSSRVNITTNSKQIYRARIPTSDFIAGVGYRFKKQRNNFFLIVQSGLRSYENPVIENLNGGINIDQRSETIGTMRYTLVYEYELFKYVFLNSEVFAGQLYSTKDFWSDRSSFGVTIGISATIF